MSSVIFVDANQTQVTILELQPGTAYIVKIEAYTVTDRLLEVGEVQVTTKSGMLHLILIMLIEKYKI